MFYLHEEVDMKSDQLIRLLVGAGVLFVVGLIISIVPKAEPYLGVFSVRGICSILLCLGAIEIFIAVAKKEALGQVLSWVVMLLTILLLISPSFSWPLAICLAAIVVVWLIIDRITGGPAKTKR